MYHVSLLFQGQVLLACYEPSCTPSGPRVSNPQPHFILLPSPSHTLLIKSVVVSELILPVDLSSPVDTPTDEVLEAMRGSLSLVRVQLEWEAYCEFGRGTGIGVRSNYLHVRVHVHVHVHVHVWTKVVYIYLKLNSATACVLKDCSTVFVHCSFISRTQISTEHL